MEVNDLLNSRIPWMDATVLLLFWNLSGTTRVSRYQKGKTRKVKTIWIYWSKR